MQSRNGMFGGNCACANVRKSCGIAGRMVAPLRMISENDVFRRMHALD
jgi:hypothetical protein